ncbi:MAG: hypothetical protein H7A36_00220 [Chlamydiales bacterium]|nr:hypothetical protein [Chlamydiales bacterium]
MANPPPTIAGPPPGVASSYTNGTEHLDPVHRAIYDLAQQYFANRTYPNSIGNAPSPWPYGPHPLLSAYPPAAQMGPYPYVVMPGPGLMLHTGHPIQLLPYGMPAAQMGQPYLMPGPGQFPTALPPEHYLPPAPLPAESPAPPPVPLSSASSPHLPVPHAPLSAESEESEESEDDASSVASSESAPLQEPSAVNEQLRRLYLETAKKKAETRLIKQEANREALIGSLQCNRCEPNVPLQSFRALVTHSNEFHNGQVVCSHEACQGKVQTKPFNIYNHMSTHKCGTRTYVCGDCACVHPHKSIFSRMTALDRHRLDRNKFHPEVLTRQDYKKFYKAYIKLIRNSDKKELGIVVYCFQEKIDQSVLTLLLKNHKNDQLKRYLYKTNQ